MFTLIAGLALLLYAIMFQSGALKWTSVSILVLFVVYSVYYVKKLLLLKNFRPGDNNLRSNLEELIANLTSYLTFYKRSYTVLYPVYFFLGLLFAGLETGSERFFETLAKPRTIIYLFLMAGVVYFLCTWFTTWYLKKLYGNHLHKLKVLLQEFASFDKDEINSLKS
jgi:hypothetical protein